MGVSSRFAIASAVAVILAAISAVRLWRPGEARHGPSCVWRPDNTAAYRVKVAASGTIHEGFVSGESSRPPTQRSLAYEATLAVRAAVDGDRKNAYVATLSSVQGLTGRGTVLRTDLGRPFAFEMDDYCRFGKFGFASAEGRESRDIKKSLLLLIEVVPQPTDKTGASTWQAKQTDTTGDYQASYRKDAATGDVLRTRLYYVRTAPIWSSVPLKAEILRSVGTFVPSDSFWLAKGNIQESMRVMSTKGEPFLRSAVDASLEAIAGDLRPEADIASLAWEGVRVNPSEKWTGSTYDDEGDKALAAASVPFPQAFDAFTKGDFYKGRIDHEAIGNMVRYLRANPAAIQELLDKIKAGEVAERLVGFIFFTLTKVGTPAAQRALAKVMQDPEHTEENRMQAIHALADVTKPLPESIDALAGMAKAFSLEMRDDNDLESTALLALGVVERNQLDGDEKELGRRAAAVLLEKLKSGPGVQERAVLIDALGNTGNPEHTGVIIGYFNDTSHLVRVSAARALSRMETPDADQALLDAVQHEASADARREIAQAWAQKGGEAGTFDVDKAMELLSKESEEDIRVELIQVLGRKVASHPAVKNALAKQFLSETSVKVKYEIGRHLSAGDISRASSGH